MKNIGVIDSGVGGLTVLFDIIKEYPNCNYYYIGDSKHCPYGERKQKEIQILSERMVEYLVTNKQIDILIIACNSASSTATEYLKERYPDVTIIEMIKPTSNYAKQSGKNSVIGVIATNITIHSNAYQNEFNGYTIYTKAIPIFVTLTEDGYITQKEEKIIFKELDDILKYNIDTLILGCTHFPILIPSIRKVFARTIITSSKAVLKELDTMLIHENKLGDLKIYTTGDEKQFQKQIKTMFRRNEKVQYLELEK